MGPTARRTRANQRSTALAPARGRRAQCPAPLCEAALGSTAPVIKMNSEYYGGNVLREMAFLYSFAPASAECTDLKVYDWGASSRSPSPRLLLVLASYFHYLEVKKT